jgi:hypothetical protein
VLDIALIEFTRPQPKPYQPENNLIDDTKYWMQQGTFSKKSLDRLLDHPETIWLNSSDSAYMGINERIHKDKLEAVDSSLMFIRPEDVTMIVTHEYARKRVRANFLYNDVRYQLCVTDQTYENQYTCEGTYRLSGKVYFCISLGVLFNNYCYKLVAGIITE